MDQLRSMKFMRRREGEKSIVRDIARLHASRQADADVPIPEGFQPLMPMETDTLKRDRSGDGDADDKAKARDTKDGTTSGPCIEIKVQPDGKSPAVRKVRVSFERSFDAKLHSEGRKKFTHAKDGKKE